MERMTIRDSAGRARLELHQYKGRWSVSMSRNPITVTGDAVDRLAAYEDLEEQGRLMLLPCPMGSTIYMIVTKHTKGREPFSFIKITELMESNVFRVCRDFGKTVFLTHEEAERAHAGGADHA